MKDILQIWPIWYKCSYSFNILKRLFPSGICSCVPASHSLSSDTFPCNCRRCKPALSPLPFPLSKDSSRLSWLFPVEHTAFVVHNLCSILKKPNVEHVFALPSTCIQSARETELRVSSCFNLPSNSDLTSASWTIILKRNISLINRTSSSILASWILLNNIEFSKLPCSFNLTIRTDLFYQLFTQLWLFFPPVFA